MKIALMSYFNTSGLATVAQEYFKCLTAYGFQVVPSWLVPPEEHLSDRMDSKLAENMMSASKGEMGASPLQFHAGLADAAIFLKNKSAAVGSIVLEGNVLTSSQVTVCQGMDSIMSPSMFCLRTCLSSGVPKSKLTYAPYPLDSSQWHPHVRPTGRSNKFRFLYMNTFYERKGWDVLLKAWWEEFSIDDPVELTIKSYRENDRADSVDVYLAIAAAKLGVDRRKTAPIKVVDEIMPNSDVPSFMKSFDAYVSPHRSEGFGMNIWHAMALGVPVICTDYGGCTDFAMSDTAWLVKKERMTKPSAQELSIFPSLAGISWAEPDLQDLRRQMRECLLEKAERQKRASVGSDLVSKKYSQSNALSAFSSAVKKANPKIWDSLCEDRDLECLARQPSPKFEDCSIPIRMIEV